MAARQLLESVAVKVLLRKTAPNLDSVGKATEKREHSTFPNSFLGRPRGLRLALKSS